MCQVCAEGSTLHARSLLTHPLFILSPRQQGTGSCQGHQRLPSCEGPGKLPQFPHAFSWKRLIPVTTSFFFSSCVVSLS